MAILVAPDGGIFVAGHSATASGGNDFVLIKYVELPAIQWQGSQVLLQFCATNNQPCRFQATTNLTDWQDLATVAPDPNGICRYTDTNVTAHPHRFYRTVPP
jgi:hypothetical protein